MLDEKTRLQKALAREPVDRPPCICPGGMMNMVTRELMEASGLFLPEAHTDPVRMARLATAASNARCFENYGLPFCMTVEAEALGATVDLGTATYEPRVVGYAIDSVAQWERLPPFDAGTGRPGVVLDAIALLAAQGGSVPIIGNLTGPMSLAGSLLEPVTLYRELRRNPGQAHAFLDHLTDHILAFGLGQLEAGADVIALSDPSGTGEILGPALFAAYELPALARIITGLRQAFPQAGIIVHICGKMHKVFPLLAGLGCDALSFDAVVSLKKAREHLPQTALMGNVSTFALESGSPDKVAALTRHCLECGVDIVSPACGMGNASPLANMQAMLTTVAGHTPGKNHARHSDS
ncbi:Methylcobalamin methyltransferase MMP0831 [Desulfovibrio sp. DV]|uniref:uroporphyrinogen decarboxylase family protein n=1 Tax=Desulfovibrio sp. DV TaxID=1844708 RepID=UPI00094BC30C|nr:uroporphyrinogen decarboxylase family protein [Desulfovibrio sp. DV]OLN28928.1 Methylcobalamin methyltransferase MMP0831 [Desulfovibrio sp. DV]